ncbi:MAG: hypothetical protein ABIB65_05740 [Candidatus Margulisiibacteriota bacterium]
MQTKLIVSLSLVVIFAFSASVIEGCSSSSTNNYYYYPNWTPDGKILCSKNRQVRTSGSGAFGGSGGSVSNNYSLTIMDIDGTNETDLKSIGNSAHVAASPLGNYFAYAEIEQNYITVVDTSGNEINKIDCGNWVDSLDWNPDETRLVFGIKTSSTSEVYVVDRDGSNKIFLTNGENVAWLYGSRIFFMFLSDIYYYMGSIAADGSSFRNFGDNSLSSPQILSSSTNTCYGKASNAYRKLEISSTSEVETVLFSPFNGYLPKLSVDGSKLVYGANDSAEMWVINVDGSGEQQIK